MLKTVERSRGKKTKGLAITYRSGTKNKFGTCPLSCKLNASGKGCKPNQVDQEYLQAVKESKPRDGQAFTYTHFNPLHWANIFTSHKTKEERDKYATINYSADSIEKIVSFFKKVPVVFVAKKDFWRGRKTRTEKGILIVRCPEETNPDKISCINCGGEKMYRFGKPRRYNKPLCARHDRDYVIGFTAHGNQKKKIEQDQKGGCYADGGNTRIWWDETADQEQKETDAEKLRKFVKSLEPGTILRHHIAGDIGKE